MLVFKATLHFYTADSVSLSFAGNAIYRFSLELRCRFCEGGFFRDFYTVLISTPSSLTAASRDHFLEGENLELLGDGHKSTTSRKLRETSKVCGCTVALDEVSKSVCVIPNYITRAKLLKLLRSTRPTELANRVKLELL